MECLLKCAILAAGAFRLFAMENPVETQTGPALYNVDFGPCDKAYAGRGLLGGVADQYWNKLVNFNVTNAVLKKSDGSTGAVMLSASGLAGGWQWGARGNNRFGWENFSDNWFLKKDTKAIISLQNLPADASYILVLYAFPDSVGRVLQANVDGGPDQQTSGNGQAITWAPAPGTNNNYLKFTGMIAQNGSLTLNLGAPGPDACADIQGLQIQMSAAAPAKPVAKAVGSGSLIRNLTAGRDQAAMFVGTSLTAGCSWPTALQSALADKYEGRVIVCSRGYAATDSRFGVRNIKTWLQEDQPDAVFIEYGINDAFCVTNDAQRVAALTRSRANLDTLTSAVRKANPDADIILLTMNNPIEKHLAARPDVEKFYQLYRDYATEHGMTLIDDYPLWKKLWDADPVKWKTYVPDGIHPTFEGNRAVVTENMVHSLEQAAETPPTRNHP